MPTVSTPPRSSAPTPSGRNGVNPLQTRRGSIVAAGATALLAMVLLLIFLDHYRSTDDSKTETVLAARSLLPKGSAGNAIAAGTLFQAINVKHSQVKPGAITDPGALRGQVTTKPIFPGEQITASDLQPRGGNGVVDELSGSERAIAVPVDASHGLSGTINAGDHVDVYGAYGLKGRQITRELAQNVLVLRSPTSAAGGVGGGNQSSDVVLQVSERLAGKLTFTAEYYKIWLTLRPPVGAKQGGRSTDDLSSAIR